MISSELIDCYTGLRQFFIGYWCASIPYDISVYIGDYIHNIETHGTVHVDHCMLKPMQRVNAINKALGGAGWPQSTKQLAEDLPALLSYNIVLQGTVTGRVPSRNPDMGPSDPSRRIDGVEVVPGSIFEVRPGDTILLTDMTDPSLNGVYEVDSREALHNDFDEIERREISRVRERLEASRVSRSESARQLAEDLAHFVDDIVSGDMGDLRWHDLQEQRQSYREHNQRHSRPLSGNPRGFTRSGRGRFR